jgi:NADH:ubiquinone oxidoreductase subunit F (NADH-binding)
MLGGAFVVYGDKADMVEQALNCVEFYRNESCGKCVPCRMGSQKMVEILTRWTQGGVSEAQFAADLKLVDDLSGAMSQTSICGLGQIVPAPVQSVLKHFRAEVEAHVMKGQCPSGICFSAANRLAELPRVGIRP